MSDLKKFKQLLNEMCGWQDDTQFEKKRKQLLALFKKHYRSPTEDEVLMLAKAIRIKRNHKKE